jgi:hypothetical protein
VRRDLLVNTDKAVFFAVAACRAAFITLGFSGSTLITSLDSESDYENL